MSDPLTGYVAQTLPGVSLVTCCKNRNENLLGALPSWLALPGISEIVIVDWSSDMPVARSLAQAGTADPRIVVVRVENEPRWVLSHAFNVGFRMARHEHILKADADIVLTPDFLSANPLSPGRFVAGNWRTAAEGQAYVNGFFLIHRADLMAVNGFNEYITTYGWDDDDLYDRLTAHGFTRVDLAPGTAHHQDHDDDARIDEGARGSGTGWDDLNAMTMFKIRTNRFIATIMPDWDANRVMRPYGIGPWQAGRGHHVLTRAGGSLHVVPGHIAATARQLAAYELLSWRAGLRAFELSADQLDLLLSCRRLDRIGPVHVELMLTGAGLDMVMAPRVLLVDLDVDVPAADPAALAALWARLQPLARGGRHLILRAAQQSGPVRGFAQGEQTPFLPLYLPMGAVDEITLDDPGLASTAPVQRLKVTPDVLATMARDQAAPTPAPAALPAPAIARPRVRLFIDTQHGLGNRLRAIGSASAIAQATGRELVVVWAPDIHCEGRLRDLFDYDGAVIEGSFTDRARAEGQTVLNYMEIEPESAKGAPLILDEGRDAYVRSAYVIDHPASTWDSENTALRALRPGAHVRDLMAGVPDHRDIALHIRMEGTPGTDTNPYDRIENWTPEGHAAIHDWRGKSHYSRFMARLDTLLRDTPGARAFLAADLPDTYAAFAQTYGDRVAGLNRGLFDRSAEQLQYALADILLLARCRHLLGSNWSSFSEAAQRFSTEMKHRELAGVDF